MTVRGQNLESLTPVSHLYYITVAPTRAYKVIIQPQTNFQIKQTNFQTGVFNKIHHFNYEKAQKALEKDLRADSEENEEQIDDGQENLSSPLSQLVMLLMILTPVTLPCVPYHLAK